ncbi:hypothetical protein [Paenibacillus agilis]|uniref:Uncharacterized protein n=1 Tax=Paenibacillus agilis TaxID=3020863 RepID=A0A559IEH4_9BACL|nr:hypothetical protein [Paenibacillus agilis]TVX86052.1 hypothetical protein FPZ44_24225 [Paenibacillus agilis]
MKTVQDLVNATREVKKGNHRVKLVLGWEGVKSIIKKRYFIYFSTAICTVDEINKTFSIDSSYGSQSTTRVCNAYRKHFAGMGYSEQK